MNNSGIWMPPIGYNAATDAYGNYPQQPRYALPNIRQNPAYEEIDLQRDQFNQRQADKALAFADIAIRPMSLPTEAQQSPAATSGSSPLGGFNLEAILKALTGAGTDTNTTVADMNQSKQGLAGILGPLLSALGVSQNSLTGSLANTGMQGVLGKLSAATTKAQGDQNTGFASSSKNADLKQYAQKQKLFNQLTGNHAVLDDAPQTEWNPMELPDTDVSVGSILAAAQPAAPPPAPEPTTQRPPYYGTSQLMSQGAVKPFQLKTRPIWLGSEDRVS